MIIFPPQSFLCLTLRPYPFLYPSHCCRYSDVGYHNIHADNKLATPYLDDISSNHSVRLENYYTQHICTPTRSQLLSGRYQIHTGLQHGVILPKQPSGVPTNIPLLSDKLKELGYSSHFVGKWHLGFYNNASCPWDRGFDSTTGYL